MPSSSIIIPFRNLLSVLLLLPLVLSCRQDELILPVPPVSGKGETAEVTLSVRIPDFRAANTRGVDEKGITEITVLMFADEGGTEKVKVKYDILGRLVAYTFRLFGYEILLCARYCGQIQTYSSHS